MGANRSFSSSPYQYLPLHTLAFCVIAWLLVAVTQAETRQDRINSLQTQKFAPIERMVDDGGDDEDDDFPHQLVVFAVGGLSSGSFSPGWLPFTYGASQAKTSHARTVSHIGHESLGWLSYFYAATPEEYGCAEDDQCDLPSESLSHFSLFDILQYDYGYSVTLFSEHAHEIESAVRHHYTVRSFSPDTLDMMKTGLVEHDLPQTKRRVLFFHFDGADQIGHSMGFDSENYHAELLCIDWQIQRLTELLLNYDEYHTTFSLISDHGGHHYRHDEFNLDTMQVPIAWWGYSVCDVSLNNQPIDITQWAPTIVDMIGLDQPPAWNHDHLEDASCDDDDGDLPYIYNGYWNDTYDGVCPVHIGFDHRSAFYADEIRIVTTIITFACTFMFGYWLFQQASAKKFG